MTLELRPLLHLMNCSGIQLKISGIPFRLTRDLFLDTFRLLLTLEIHDVPSGGWLQMDGGRVFVGYNILITFVVYPVMHFYVVGLGC